ncbi:MAG TPA: cyclic nucleotide-binding domain-containing protein [Desulfopila sp.]|nr:cyclic nucleotide-binding domain-containing protein [Desulfopila sp.]
MKTQNQENNSECKLTCDFEILRRSPVFSGIDTNVVKLFAYLAKRKKVKKGQAIITLGAEASEAFFLISGSGRVSAPHGGKECVLQGLGPHTFFGELALLARFNWFFNVFAEEESDIMIITRESFKKVLDNFPQHREKLVEKIVQLRVERLIDQTSFLLDKLPDNQLAEGSPSI